MFERIHSHYGPLVTLVNLNLIVFYKHLLYFAFYQENKLTSTSMWKYFSIYQNIMPLTNSKPYYYNMLYHIQCFYFLREWLGNGGQIREITI